MPLLEMFELFVAALDKLSGCAVVAELAPVALKLAEVAVVDW